MYKCKIFLNSTNTKALKAKGIEDASKLEASSGNSGASPD